MKNPGFLRKLWREGKLVVVEPSDDVKESYLAKADNCLKSAKILLQSGLYENSVGEAYYGMYNCLSALLYKVGIKCENHSASIILLGTLFGAGSLARTISLAKRERIDKQYYVESRQKAKVTEGSCRGMILKTEDFIIKMKILIGRISVDDVAKARSELARLLG